MEINSWIQEQVPLYQEGLPLKPVKNGRVQYNPSLTVETLEVLDRIPGLNASRKINLLYWNYVAREEKKARRYAILGRLFPKK